jgi:hypothetical protein
MMDEFGWDPVQDTELWKLDIIQMWEKCEEIQREAE